MKTVNLEQFRAAIEAGGVIGVTLVGQGGAFAIEARVRAGEPMWLATQRDPSPRLFRDQNRAARLLLDMGVRRWETDASQYRPEEGELLKRRRPDAARTMRAVHSAARQFSPDVLELVAERSEQAKQPGAVLIPHEQVMAEARAAIAAKRKAKNG